MSDVPCLSGEGHSKASLACKGCGNYLGPKEPWAYYTLVYDDVDGEKVIVAKRVKGRVCYRCLAAFRVTGWGHQYQTIANYVKLACTPVGRSTHQDFWRNAQHVQPTWKTNRPLAANIGAQTRS